MRNLSLLLALFVFISCNKKDEADDTSLGFEQLLTVKYSFNAEDIVGESSGTCYAARVGNNIYLSKDGGNTWTVDPMSGSEVHYVSKLGRMIFKSSFDVRLWSEEGIITFNDQGVNYLYYLDELDNVYFFKKAFAAGMENELFIAPSGSNYWEKITVPENFTFDIIDIYPGGGIASLNAGTMEFQIYNPSSDAWTSVPFSTNRSIDMNKLKIGQNGFFYLGDQDGVDEFTLSGITNSFDFPENIVYYDNPFDIQVSANGKMVVKLGSYTMNTSLFMYENSAWVKFTEAMASHLYDNHGTYYVSDEELVFPGMAYSGNFTNAVAFYNLNTGSASYSGAEVSETNYTFVHQTAGGTMLLKISGNPVLYTYSQGNLNPTMVLGASDLYEAPNGNLYFLQENALTVTDANVNILDSIPELFSKEGFTPYDGYPQTMCMQQLNDGSFLMMGTLEYEYAPGGTGFVITQYRNMILSSDDGLSWSREPESNTSGGIGTVIDKDGIMFMTDVQNSVGMPTVYVNMRSDDRGKNWVQIESRMPDMITSNGTLLSLNYEQGKWQLSRFNGESWEHFETSETIEKMFSMKRMAGNDKVIVGTGQTFFISKRSF